MSRVIGVTGHRKFSSKYPCDWVADQLRGRLYSEKSDVIVLTGMAIGFDQLVAEVCINLGVPFVAAIPFEGQESIWNDEQKLKYYDILLKAKEIVVVSEGGWSSPRDNWKFQHRNEWIVNNLNDRLVSYYENKSTKNISGTLNCMRYAKKAGVAVDSITGEKWE